MNKNNTYTTIIIIYAVLSMGLYKLIPGSINSNFFLTTITFVVGCSAIYIYIKQKADEKQKIHEKRRRLR